MRELPTAAFRALVLPLLPCIAASELTSQSVWYGYDYANSLTAVGDADRDGHGDFLVQTLYDYALHLISGRDGRLRHSFVGGFGFGSPDEPVGDLDGDGASDIVLSDYDRFSVYSGASLQVLWTVRPVPRPCTPQCPSPESATSTATRRPT